MSLMRMQLWTLGGLGPVLILVLGVQTVATIIYILFVVFPAMGRNYFAAVIASGFSGISLGATPTAIANAVAIGFFVRWKAPEFDISVKSVVAEWKLLFSKGRRPQGLSGLPPCYPQQAKLGKRLFVVSLGFLLLAPLTGRANPPDSLTNDIEPAVRASELVSPFTEIVAERNIGFLRAASTEPFINDTEFSLQPRFYFREFKTFPASTRPSLQVGR
jgi:hypothetical protein